MSIARRDRVIRKKAPLILPRNARTNNTRSGLAAARRPSGISVFTHNSLIVRHREAQKPGGSSSGSFLSPVACPVRSGCIHTVSQSMATGSGFTSTNVMILIKCLDYSFFENYRILTHQPIAPLAGEIFLPLVLNRCERVPSSPARAGVQLVLDCKTAWSRL